MRKSRSAPRLILASASPRRRELLARFGIEFSVVPSRFDEAAVPYTRAEDYVRELSAGKAETVAARYPESWVLAADTIVVADDRLLGKPADRDEARKMMGALSGRNHRVHTGFSLRRRADRRARDASVCTEVRFRELSAEEIEWYVRTDEPYDKAGGYGIQGLAGLFVAGVSGSCSNVVGLPVAEVVSALVEEGVLRFRGNGTLGFPDPEASDEEGPDEEEKDPS
jgi:septum formation protein